MWNYYGGIDGRLMKKILLVLSCLTCLLGCNAKSDKKYSSVKMYRGVSYSFDEQLKCYITYDDYATGKIYSWYVYLKDFYADNYDDLHKLYVCTRTSDNVKEYILIMGVL